MGSVKLTFEDSDSGWEVIDSSGSVKSSGHDGDGRHEIVCEGIVEVALDDRREVYISVNRPDRRRGAAQLGMIWVV